MSEDQRTAVIIAERAQSECRACRWLGDDADQFDAAGRYTHAECPSCGSRKVRDYESALYSVGY
jgi:Zn finger protein HypA/HybF involved in hydrogenase expression